MRAGKLRWRLQLLRPETTKDSFGDVVTTLVPVQTVMAGDEPLSLRGTSAVLGIQAGALSAQRLRWITIRHRDDITEGWCVMRESGNTAGKQMDVIAVRAGETPVEMNLIVRLPGA